VVGNVLHRSLAKLEGRQIHLGRGFGKAEISKDIAEAFMLSHIICDYFVEKVDKIYGSMPFPSLLWTPEDETKDVL
jgi:hypothetical protein